jgi:hypothetical protein
MTSPSRRTRKPVKSIRINARVQGGDAEILSLKRKLAGAKATGDTLQFSIQASELGEAIEQLRNLGDTIKAAAKTPKGFKQSTGSRKIS